MSRIRLRFSVGGNGGRNKAIDVAFVQRLLRNYYAAQKKKKMKDKFNYHTINVNGISSPFLIKAIETFQIREQGKKKPDGRVDVGGATYRKLIKMQSKKPVSVRDSILGTDANIHSISLSKLPITHFRKIFKRYHFLTTTKGEDMIGFLELFKKDTDLKDVRWAAYVLASIYHETGKSFKPVIEDEKGKGRAYDIKIKVTDKDGIRGKKGKTYNNVYYGRGYIQITHADNYKTMGKELGLGDKLYIDPELALGKELSYKIASYGMRHGTFTSRKLSHYFNSSKTDYLYARRIVNRLDKYKVIAAYGKSMELLLRLAMRSPAEKAL